MRLFIYLQNAFMKAEQYTRAKEVLYEVIERDRENSNAYFTLGSILEKENDIDFAIDMYQKCIE